MNELPALFLQRLKSILPSDQVSSAIAVFSLPRALTVRINTLKISVEDALKRLDAEKIRYRRCLWSDEALILENLDQKEFGGAELASKGFFYSQSLSSMLPAIVLDPQPGERILDMCAAPGSKTTQIAALMKNEGTVLALEAVSDRYYRLRSVVQQLGAGNVTCRLMDARKLRPFDSPQKAGLTPWKKKYKGTSRNKAPETWELFDRILVDSPCSSEGRFRLIEPKTFAYWSPRKIKEMVEKQRGLLMSASRLLKTGGVLVYSTCTFAPEENEGVVDWLLRKTKGTLEIVPIDCPSVPRYGSITHWEGRSYLPEVAESFRVLPDAEIEGFYMAKFRKPFLK